MKKKILIAFLVLLVLMFSGSAAYFLTYYHAVDVDGYLDGSKAESVEVVHETGGDYAAWFFDGPGNDTAFVFYPGAKVEASSYAELMCEIAEGGIDCYLLEVPLRFAFFDLDAAMNVQTANRDKYEKWIIGGHSLGGAMAANLMAKDEEKSFDGLVLLAAFGTKACEDIDIISIYGSEDSVINVESHEKYMEMEKAAGVDIDVNILEGCNHAQFGSYGEQKGDGIATKGREYQIETTAKLIDEFFLDEGKE